MRVQFLVCAFSVRFPLRRRDGFSEAYFCVLFPLSYLLSASSRISIGHSMTLVWHLENGLSMSTNSAMAALRYGLTLAISRKRRAYLKGLLTPTGVSSPTCGSPRYFHLGQDDERLRREITRIKVSRLFWSDPLALAGLVVENTLKYLGYHRMEAIR